VADNMFVQQSVALGGKRKYTVLISIVTHTLVLAAAIMVPLVATDSVVLPTRLVIVDVFPIHPPLPPAPPLPRGPAKEPLPIVKPTIVVEAPGGITPEIPIRPSEPLPGVEFSTGLVPGVEYSAAPPSPPPASVAAQVPVRAGVDIKRPAKVKDAVPIYPATARAARVEGIVIVEATIGPDGKVQDARILRSIRWLDDAALDAVRQWEYTPTLLNGTPIAIVMTVTVNFRLQ
jgi:protein TonB